MRTSVTYSAGERPSAVRNRSAKADRDIAYHGSQAGRVALKERQLRVTKPRLRKKSPQPGEAGEVEIPAYEAMRKDGRLADRMLEILLDGVSTRSCLTFAVMADGASIMTIEGLGTAEKMHPLQQAFWEKHGLQCGFCTPGMLMTAAELLKEKPKPSVEEIREALSGNLCRCTGYQTIVESVQRAAELMQGGK